MFSLAKYKRPTFEMEIKENVIIHIFPPTKSRTELLLAAETVNEDALYNLIAELVSDNEEKYIITGDDMRIYADDVLIAFLSAYQKFVQGIYNLPN